MKNFEGLGLNKTLEKSLAHMNYSAPTPIQAQAIPLALDGHDIMGSAQTGTGKTAAFAIPLVEKLLSDPYGSALVMTPTRELGKQIMTIMHQLLGPKSPIRTAFIIGGEPMGKQLNQLRNRPRLIVATPGRLNDHLERGNISLYDTHFLVLDETDRMLDMGFTIQLEKIFEYMPKERQTLMFSATLPKNILKMSDKYMNNPKRVEVGEVNVIAKNIKQEIIRIEQDKKYNELKAQLEQRDGSVIVFVKTKHGADRMANNLRRDGYTSEALHGDLRQNKRDKVMQNFRKMNFRVLIATDIAARGLDVPHIEHVINYDLPQVAEDFIHRMGRTARAGAQGSAVSFVSNQDGRKWHAIERLLNPDAANNNSPERRPKQNRNKSRFKNRDNNRDNKKPFEKKDRKPNKPKEAREATRGAKEPSKNNKDGFKGKDRKFDPSQNVPKKSKSKNYKSDKPKAPFKKERSNSDNRNKSAKPHNKKRSFSGKKKAA